jgi:hypothetical protein
VTARWRVAAGVTATTTLTAWGWSHGSPVPNGATLAAVAVLAAVLWLLVKLRPHDTHDVPPDVMERIDDVLPRSQETDRWKANREDLMQ